MNLKMDWKGIHFFKMERLPIELYLNFVEYLEYEDQLSWGCCCSTWYSEIVRNHVRVVRIHSTKYTSRKRQKTAEIFRMIPRLIKDSSKQLEIEIDLDSNATLVRSYSHFLSELLQLVGNSSLKSLYCSPPVLKGVLSLRPDLLLRLNKYSSNETENDEGLEDYEETLEPDFSLALSHLDPIKLENLSSSHYHFLQHAQNGLDSLTNLTMLELHDCNVSDVSMLGHIPYLQLRFCDNITDISALNHNRSILIFNCNNILDYTRSFEYCEDINLDLSILAEELQESDSPEELSLPNVKRWKNVETLELTSDYPFFLSPCRLSFQNMRIPETVVNCSLDGIAMDLMLTAQHRLRKLTIDSNDCIISLVNLGWEQLVDIKLRSLPQLSSLEGIGCGKNQNITICSCSLITDYSPLRYVHTVEITAATINLDELDYVRILKLRAKSLQMTPGKCYHQIQELDIFNVDNIWPDFYGLARIPIIIVNTEVSLRMLQFLRAGEKLYHQKIIARDNESSRQIYQDYLLNSYHLSEKSDPYLKEIKLKLLVMLRN